MQRHPLSEQARLGATPTVFGEVRMTPAHLVMRLVI
jgi:hypothetical protein